LGQCVILFPSRDCGNSFTFQVFIIRLHSAAGALYRKLVILLLIKEKVRDLRQKREEKKREEGKNRCRML